MEGVCLAFVVFLSLLSRRSSLAEEFDRSADLEEEFSAGFIRICTSSGQQFETRAKNCPKGVFLKKPLVPGCVCMQGTWVLHPTLCDMTSYIFYGEVEMEQCYQLDFPVNTFIYLGDPSNIFASRTYVSPHSLFVFHEVKNGSATPKLNYHWPSIISVNPVLKVEGTEDGKSKPICFRKREFIPKKSKMRVHIWSSGMKPTSYKLVASCSKGAREGGYDDLVGTHKDNYYRSLDKLEGIPVSGCSTVCDKGTTTTTTPKPPKAFFFDLNKVNESAGSSGLALDDGLGIEPQQPAALSTSEPKVVNGGQATESNPPEGVSDPGVSSAPQTLKRQKRYKVRESLSAIWDGMAYCMKSYWDPLLYVEMQSEIEKRCYPTQAP